MKSITLIIICYISCLLILTGDEEKVMDHHAEILSKSDIGYMLHFSDGSALPSRIEILIHVLDERKALESLKKSPLENINEKLLNEKRVYFSWRSIEDDKSVVWSFAEKGGKIRLHDKKEKQGHWVDLADFLKMVAKKSNGNLKVRFPE